MSSYSDHELSQLMKDHTLLCSGATLTAVLLLSHSITVPDAGKIALSYRVGWRQARSHFLYSLSSVAALVAVTPRIVVPAMCGVQVSLHT